MRIFGVTKIPSTASPEDESFAIFRQDKLANRWRSATFQSIATALTANGGFNSAPMAEFSADNVNQTVNRIIGVLSEVSQLSSTRVSDEMKDRVREMANLCLNIALQFGIHTAELRLSI